MNALVTPTADAATAPATPEPDALGPNHPSGAHAVAATLAAGDDDEIAPPAVPDASVETAQEAVASETEADADAETADADASEPPPPPPGPRRVRDPLSPEAFRAELEPLIPQVRAFARFLCQSDRAAADDLAQEALLRAWQARASFEPGTQLRAWLFVIVRNLFYSDRRRAWRSVAYDETAAERTLQTKSVQAELLELDDVRRALGLLPDDQREALILVTAGGLSYEEAAHICGCAVGTIKSRVNRGRRALAQILETQNVPPRDAPAENALGALLDDARRIASER